MKIIFACGGTGGHINPALALAKLVRERRPRSGILFVGANNGMETKLVPREGFEIKTIAARSFRHKLTPAALWWNLGTVVGMANVLKQAGAILDEYKPKLVVGTGGFACFPMVYQAARRGIATAVHESNVEPGWATRALANKVDRVMVGFADSTKHYKRKAHVVVTGTPVREDFIYGKKDEVKRALQLDDRPVVVAYFGSLGAREMNKMMVDYMARLADSAAFQLIYATGSFGARWMPDRVAEHGIRLEEKPFIHMQEYIYNMPEVMSAADVVITRSGASTLTELAISAKPAILVPSPNVTGNQQEKNANPIGARGAAVVLLEKDCDGNKLYDQTMALLQAPDRLAAMSEAMRALAFLDANERIYQTIMALTE